MSKTLDVVQYIHALAGLKSFGETPEIKRVVYNDVLIHDPEIYRILNVANSDPWILEMTTRYSGKARKGPNYGQMER